MEGTGMISGTPVRQDGKKLWQYLAAISASLLAAGAGSALGWPSPVLPQLLKPETPNITNNANVTTLGINGTNVTTNEPWIVITEEQGSWIGSLLALGAMAGALVASKMADKFGRKKSILSLAVPYLLAWLMIAVGWSLWIIYVARFIIGIGVGASCVLAPTYVSEIAEISARGTLGTMFQLFFTIGILYVFIFGSIVGYTTFAILCALIEVLFVITFVWMPESPVWLIGEGRRSDATIAMTTLRGDTYNPNEELSDMQKAAEECSSRELTVIDLVRSAPSRKALTAALGCMIFQQLSGINAVISYTFAIFKAAGSSMAPEVAAIIVAVVQVVMSGVATLIVDRAGRKPLLMISSGVMSLSLIAFGLYFKLQNVGTDVSNLGWLPLSSLTLFMIAFCIGLGPIPWMITAELFPAETKAVASGIAVMVNWLLVFIVIKTFPAMQNGLGADWTFWLFAVIMAACTVFSYFFIPETKGKTVQEIQDELNGVIHGNKSKA